RFLRAPSPQGGLCVLSRRLAGRPLLVCPARGTLRRYQTSSPDALQAPLARFPAMARKRHNLKIATTLETVRGVSASSSQSQVNLMVRRDRVPASITAMGDLR